MKVKNIIYEDFQNFKETSMFIGTEKCNWKCCIEQHLDPSICQNSKLVNEESLDISIHTIIDQYINNDITHSIVFGGLEPILQIDDILEFLYVLRWKKKCNDTVVIYTGYYPDEIENELELLKHYENIIVKFGRYIPNATPKFDNTLGVMLASNNQYATYIS